MTNKPNKTQELFDYFGVKNDKELMEFRENNPTDPRVKELTELYELLKQKDTNDE